MSDKIVAPTIGRCIYCGASGPDVALTDEHIIPFALNGSFVLKSASCPDCQDTTKHIEQNVLRPMLGPTRVRANLRTRNKKDREKPFPIKMTTPDGETKVIDVPPADIPTYLFLPIFAPPGLLFNRGPEDEIPLNAFWYYSFDSDAHTKNQKLASKLGKGQATYLHLRLDEFARMIVKIGYAYAVGAYTMEGFLPLVTGIIRKTQHDISTYVGTTPEIPAPDPNALHTIKTGWCEPPHQSLLRVRVCLFSNLGAPQYDVIVGRRTD